VHDVTSDKKNSVTSDEINSVTKANASPVCKNDLQRQNLNVVGFRHWLFSSNFKPRFDVTLPMCIVMCVYI
jgi:hypothetical protein